MGEWQHEAACIGHGDLFFPVLKRGIGGSSALRAAARICHPCPVRAECAERAQGFYENGFYMLFGVWAGTVYYAHKPPEIIQAFCAEPGCDRDPDGGLGRCNACYLKYRKRQRAALEMRQAAS